MNTAAYLISLVFLARELTHREHLKTKSYAAHVALQGFYEGIIPLADAFAETYQGINGIIDNIPPADSSPAADIITTLRTQVEWIEAHRDEFSGVKSRPLQNTIDTVCDLYYSTIYKLENLK